jgi:hypothetical protein
MNQAAATAHFALPLAPTTLSATYPSPRLIPPPGRVRTQAFVILAFPLGVVALLLFLAAVSGSSSPSVPQNVGQYGSFLGAAGGNALLPTAPPTTADLATTDPSAAVLATTDPAAGQQDETFAGPSATPDDPVTVAQAFFDALNRGDYQGEWAKGSAVLGSSATDDFQTAFRNTTRVDPVFGQATGDTVPLSMLLTLNDGSQERFNGVVTADDGVVTLVQATRQ